MPSSDRIALGTHVIERLLGESSELGVFDLLCRQSVRFLSGNVDDFDMVGRRESLAPMWKHLGKHIDMAVPTPLLTHVYLG